jgi:hypothetical protein
MLNTIYTSDELDNVLNSLNYTSRVNFIKRYINNLIHENEVNNGGNYKLFSTGLIKNPNDEIIVDIITGSTTFFTFPLRDNDDNTYIVSSIGNCIDFRDIMNNMLLYI